MEWKEIAMLIIGNVAWALPLFLWLRSEGNSDRRDILNVLFDIKDEQKDFHGRLCKLEEKYIQMMEKHLEKGRK